MSSFAPDNLAVGLLVKQLGFMEGMAKSFFEDQSCAEKYLGFSRLCRAAGLYEPAAFCALLSAWASYEWALQRLHEHPLLLKKHQISDPDLSRANIEARAELLQSIRGAIQCGPQAPDIEKHLTIYRKELLKDAFRLEGPSSDLVAHIYGRLAEDVLISNGADAALILERLSIGRADKPDLSTAGGLMAICWLVQRISRSVDVKREFAQIREILDTQSGNNRDVALGHWNFCYGIYVFETGGKSWHELFETALNHYKRAPAIHTRRWIGRLLKSHGYALITRAEDIGAVYRVDLHNRGREYYHAGRRIMTTQSDKAFSLLWNQSNYDSLVPPPHAGAYALDANSEELRSFETELGRVEAKKVCAELLRTSVQMLQLVNQTRTEASRFAERRALLYFSPAFLEDNICDRIIDSYTRWACAAVGVKVAKVIPNAIYRRLQEAIGGIADDQLKDIIRDVVFRPKP